MRYYDTQIVLQEVPDEVSIAFSITGCNIQCKGCHSPYLWNKNKGLELTDDVFIDILTPYIGLATCVLFYGGEWHQEELIEKLIIAKKNGFLTCLYTGEESISFEIEEQLDYLKVGPWIESKGGLDNPDTNQRFIDIKAKATINYKFRNDKNEKNNTSFD